MAITSSSAGPFFGHYSMVIWGDHPQSLTPSFFHSPEEVDFDLVLDDFIPQCEDWEVGIRLSRVGKE
jgi:hypothetical protein